MRTLLVALVFALSACAALMGPSTVIAATDGSAPSAMNSYRLSVAGMH